MLSPGTAAPDIEVGAWRLSDALKKGPVLLAFFKISCPTCQMTLPFLRRLEDNASSGAPQLVAISQDDARSTAQFQQRFGPTEQALLDERPAYAASNAFGLTNVPALFLVEPDGRISLAVSGFSKAHLETVGERFGVSPFQPGDKVPEMRPG